MSNSIKIGDNLIGNKNDVYLIAEIGINHNGDFEIAKQLIDCAVKYNFHAVKFQKRTVDIVFTQEDLERLRESPFGKTNGDLKRGLEFGKEEFLLIDEYCKKVGIDWFCSPWDENSVDFLEFFNPVCYKIASASITDINLLKHIKSKSKPIILSTGMSTLDEIDVAVETLKGSELILLHTTSTYPCPDEDLNLMMINTLRKRYNLLIGYSGHETGVMPSVFAATSFGACVIERHVTLNRAMWGSDQSASLEPKGMELLSRSIRQYKIAHGDGVKVIKSDEIAVKEKLRRIG